MKKFATFILAILAILVFATWQYRLLSVLIIVWMWKDRIKALPLMAKHKHGYKALVAFLLLCIWIAIPNYFQRGRTQLVYLNETGKPTYTPLHIYALNVLFPEEEVMNFGFKTAGLLSGNTSGQLIKEAQRDLLSLRALDFYTPYNRLSLSGCNPGTFTIAQVWNMLDNDNLNAIYVTKPKHYDKAKAYPVVFFAHGYMGSWELYNGLLNRLDDCIVVAIGTRDISGIFTEKDIEKCFSQYIPYLEEQGFSVNRNSLHLIGLSNGGTAADVAVRDFSHRFASVTYVSTWCTVIKHSNAKVLMIGGGKDLSSANLPYAKQQLKECGTDARLLWYEDEGHYLLVHKADEVVAFLKEAIGE